jgi:predicted double-glycine peptidase
MAEKTNVKSNRLKCLLENVVERTTAYGCGFWSRVTVTDNGHGFRL